MRPWIMLVLLIGCSSTWLSMPRIGYAQQTAGSVTLPSTTLATDGEFIAWIVPAAHNGGVSAVYAATLRDNPPATSTLIATESEPEITTLLLSDGIVVWATPASEERLTL